ncbi:MAG: DegV family protein [Defluviitaleaceae bacterium]|nr:DegV family protein [Defluviitaleaceae bacterium]MCL2262634.1 DegV family protein [Defluviitaleaceae bacterium]
MFQVISDSGCDFTKDEAKDISIVPFYISFDQKNHLKEGIDISLEDYFQRLVSEKNVFPKTAQPSPQDYIDAFKPHLEAGRDIISVTISSKFSGSYNSATLAADMLKEEYPNRIIKILDSLNGSVGQGLVLREIIKMQNAGYNLQKTVKLAEEIIKTTRLYFTVDNLEYLKRGGRIGPTTALVGGLLGLRPILQVENGQVSQLDNVRGKKNALKLIQEAMVNALQDEPQNVNISIGHILSEQEAVDFKTKTEAALGIKIANPITEVGAAIGSHAGPGALAFAYCKKYNAIEGDAAA